MKHILFGAAEFVPDVVGGRQSTDEGTSRWLSVEAGLWQLVVLAFVLDVYTTVVGIELGFVEFNPLVRTALAAFGTPVIWVLKGVALSVGLSCWAALARKERVLVPISVGLPWTVAAVSNLGLFVAV